MTVHGIGGVFFKADDPESMREWYAEHLGIDGDQYGTVFKWRRYDRPGDVGNTVWNPFPAETEYFDPSESDWMLNYCVDDLEATLERLDEAGVERAGEVQEFEYGKFGWVLDPEGNKIELWEPPEASAFEGDVPGSTEGSELTGTWAAPPGTTMAVDDAQQLSDRVIEKSCEVGLSISELWRLWTTGEGMAEWWVEENNIELRVGGPYELYMLPDAPDGNRGSDGCRILSFLPKKMLSFTWNAPPNLTHTRVRHTHVVLQFEELGDARSAVALSHLGWPTSQAGRHEEWEATYAYFDDAWETVLDMLLEFVERQQG
jgi:uncharacterized protein YndB with AHSA1/START domain/predicted enzyme related to lactoylglutathione lyase